MLEGLRRVDETVVPFVSMCYSSPSGYLWEDQRWHDAHHCSGRRGKARSVDALLFSLGQHPALVAVQQQLREGKYLFAYLDDIYVVTEPNRVRTVVGLLENALWAWAGMWNRAGMERPGFEILERVARIQDPSAVVWKGPELPAEVQGLNILGTPMGNPEFVRAHLERTIQKHRKLFERVPMVPDVESSWLLLLRCASARANYMTRVVETGSARSFCEAYDVGIWQCLEEILQNPLAQVGETKNFGSLPIVLGGIGLRSAARTSMPAYWASWSNILAMIRRRHPSVAGQLVNQLQGNPEAPFLRAEEKASNELMGVMGFEPPSWQDMSEGARPPPLEPKDEEPGTVRRGWQHEVCSRVGESSGRSLSHTHLLK